MPLLPISHKETKLKDSNGNTGLIDPIHFLRTTYLKNITTINMPISNEKYFISIPIQLIIT